MTQVFLHARMENGSDVLGMYRGFSCPKLMERLYGNICSQIFCCDVIIELTRQLTTYYKLLDDVTRELTGALKVQQLRDIFTSKRNRIWRIRPRCEPVRHPMN